MQLPTTLQRNEMSDITKMYQEKRYFERKKVSQLIDWLKRRAFSRHKILETLEEKYSRGEFR